MITTALQLTLGALVAFLATRVLATRHALTRATRKANANETRANELQEQLTRALMFRDHWNKQALATLAELKAEQTRHARDIETQAHATSALLTQRNALSVQVSNMAHELNNANERERNARATLAHLETSTAFTLGELDEMKRTRALFAVIDELAK